MTSRHSFQEVRLRSQVSRRSSIKAPATASSAIGLKLNVGEADNAMDLGLARSVAPYSRVSSKAAGEIVARGQAVVKQWPRIADSLQIRAREQERMAAAFRLAG